MAETRWTPETRKGTFTRFFELCSELSEADFLERFPHPTLLTTMSVERAAWDGAILLVVVKAPGAEEGDILLGRDEASDIAIAQAGISKQHAVFSRVEDKWFIEDLESSNGTKLNGTPLERDEKTELPGDTAVLDFGGVRLTYNTPASLYQFLGKIKEHEKAPKPAPVPKPSPPPTRRHDWNASSSAKTDLAIPIPQITEGPSRTTGRLPKTKGSSGEVPVPFLKKQLYAVVGTPKRVFWSLVVVAAIAVSALSYGRSLAYMLFGESHPEWFK